MPCPWRTGAPDLTRMVSATHGTRRHRLIVDGAYLPEASDVRAVVWDGTEIVWVGTDPDDAPPADETTSMPGAWITPGFVDAHVHGTATGLTLDGIDLTGAGSAREVEDRVRAFAQRRDDDPVIGSGWASTRDSVRVSAQGR